MALAGTGVVVAIVLAAEPILRILGGSEYVAAAPVLRIQSLALLTLFVSAAWTPALVAMRHQGAVARAVGIGLAVAVCGGLALIPALEATGAAIAAAAADAFVMVAVFVLLRRVGPGRELRLGFALRLAVAALAALSVALLPGVPALLDALLALLVLAGAALALRIVPGDAVHLLPGRARA
jgi:O-antigen/teichoic acid export membrane protein